jgi:hypothetical protein
MRISKQLWQHIRETYARSLAPRGIHLSVDRAWARTSDGRWLVLPAATDHPKPDSWWLGFDEQEIARRAATGAVLLCRSSDGTIADFGLPGDLLREIAPHLVVKRGTHHRQFTVVRRAGRYALVMKRGREIDITPRRGDLSWLALSAAPRTPAASELELAYGARTASTAPQPNPGSGSPTVEKRFFARCREGKLHPVDPVDLDEGAVYLVVAAPAPALPVVGAERRILAAARSLGLPADLSEQHDHYAHGAPRR